MTEQEYKEAWRNETDANELATMADELKKSYAWKKVQATTPTVDVEEQWSKFRAHHPMPQPSAGWHRWAVAASMLLLCSIALAIGWTIRERTPKHSAIQTPEATATAPCDSIHEDSTKLTFRNTSLRVILNEIAQRHGAQVRDRSHDELYLYVELEKDWTLQQCIDFLNHFEHVQLSLTSDNVIVAE